MANQVTFKNNYMNKINLEAKLLKTNPIVSEADLLSIGVYDKLGGIDSDVLARVGMDLNIKTGEAKKKIHAIKNETELDKKRILHISQIEQLCRRYYLRFLPSKMFCGEIDRSLPLKIETFEIATGRTCNKENCYIAAPKRAFKLEKRSKDPILFFKLNEEYFYLIHKWGDDLSFWNRLKGALSWYFSGNEFIKSAVTASCLTAAGFLFWGEAVIIAFSPGAWIIVLIIHRIFEEWFNADLWDSKFE